MIEKRFKTRLIQIHDSDTNWTKTEVENKGANFVPESGEIVVYEFSDGSRKFKIGNGLSKVEKLPFQNAVGPQGEKGDKGDKGDPQTLYHKGIIMEATNLTVRDSFISLKIYFDMYSFSPVIYGDSATEKIPEQVIFSRGFIRTKVTASSNEIDYQLAYIKLYHNGAATENKYSAEIAYWNNGAIKQVTVKTYVDNSVSMKVIACTNSVYIDI